MTYRSMLAAAVLAVAAPVAFAGSLPPQVASYSAKAVYQVDNTQYASTMIADHGRERRVIDTPIGPQTLLIDPKAGKAYLVNSPMGTLALDLSSKVAGVDLTQLYSAEAKPVGRETIDGLAVTKYHLVPTQRMRRNSTAMSGRPMTVSSSGSRASAPIAASKAGSASA